MRKNTRRILSWVLAMALLLTCTISGLVLPAAAESDNLLTNGDFEQGGTGWGTDPKAEIADGHGKDGSKGMKIATEVLEGGASVYPGVYYKGQFHAMLEANTTYIFSFDYKHEGKGWGQMKVLRTGTDWTGWATKGSLTATEWTTVTIEFTTGAAENMNASTGWEWKAEQVQYANAPGTGATYFDNFKLIKKPTAATGIVLDKTAAEVEVGKEITLTASATPAGATLPEITWTTGDANIATVENGKVTGVAVGATTITATAGELTATCTVTVKEAVLLTNGDFEQGGTGWGTDPKAEIADGHGKDGSKGMKIATEVLEGGASVYPGVYYKGQFHAMLEANTTYIFSFDYKHEGKGWGQLKVLRTGTDWTGWATKSNLTATEWTTVTIEFTTGAAENMNASTGWEWKAEQVQYANAPGTGATYYDNFKLVKKPTAVTGITLDKTAVEVEVGKDVTLTASATPAGATLPAITWTSSDETVATVDATGKVTAVKAGTATITATAGELTATCTVTVKEAALLTNGDLEQGASVAWGGSSYVQNGVGKDGSVGIKFETTTQEGDAAKTPGVYYKGAFNGALKPNTTYIFSFDYKHEGKGWGQLDVVYGGTDWTGWADTILPSNVDWTRQTFEFTTGAADKMNIKEGWEWQVRLVHYSNAANWGTASAQFDNFELIEKPKEITATGITLDKTTATLEIGADTTLNVSVVPSEAPMPEITWTSSDETVATVDATGKVTAVKAGTATITATAGELTATCTVTVKEAALLTNGDLEQGASVAWGGSSYVQNGVGKDGSVGIKFETTTQEGDAAKTPGVYYKGAFNGALKPNTTYIFSFDYKHEGKGWGQLDVVYGGTDWTGWADTILPSNVDWTRQTFEFTTGAADKMNIKEGWEWQVRLVHYSNAANWGTASAQFDNFELIEKPKTAEPTGIVLDKTTANVVVGGGLSLTVAVTPGDAEMPTITWTSSDETVATVDATGKVTAVKAGTATITATAGKLSATCTVTVSEPVNDGNLLVNGNFEQGASIAWGDSTYVQSGVGKDGTWGIKIATEVLEGQVAKYPGPYYKESFVGKLKPNTKYIFTFDYKHEGQGFGQINVVNKPADWTGWENSANLTATEWTTVTIEFTTGAEANLTDDKLGWEWMPRHVHYANAANYGTGAVYFDNFKLIEKIVVEATEIKFDKNAATLEIGQTTNLTVTAEPENAEQPVVEWSTSNADVATVVDGKVTAVAEGTATITATFGELKATCAITVIKDDGNIIINGNFENGKDAWGRDQAQKDRIQAGVGKDGTSGIKLSTNITETTTAHQTPGVYYLNETIAAMKPDTIYEFSFDYKHEGMGFGQIVFNKVPGKLPNGSEFKNTALASGDVDWTTKTYTIVTPSVMTDANTGWEWQVRQVQYYDKGVGAGTTYFDNFKLVEVGKVVHADSIAISPETLELLPFDSASVAVSTTPIGASTGVLTWTSSDPTIVSVDATGKVTALAASGEATITVTNDKGKTATAKVVITEYGNLIKNGDFEQGAVNWDNKPNVKPGIGKNGGYGFELTHDPANGGWSSYYYKGSFVGLLQPATTYQFSIDYYSPSEDSSVRFWTGSMGMTLSNSACKYGSGEWKTLTKIFTTPTDLKINTGWDLSLVCEKTGSEPLIVDNVTLKKYSSGVDATSLTMNLNTLTLIPGRTGALSVHAFPVEADLNDMVWTTSDPNVAIVEYGVVTGVSKGKATITASKNGLSATCEVTVSGNELLIDNGTFDIENNTSWTTADGAAIVAGEGRLETNAAALVGGSSVKQTFTGLEADTPYQLFLYYRTTKGDADITLTNGETVLLEGKTEKGSLWTKMAFEFTTPETLESDETTLTIATKDGTVYVDNVILAVKASLIDFVISDIIWDGGGYQVTPGTKLTFAVTLTNNGTDPVPKDAVVTVDMCKNGETFQTIDYKLPAQMGSQESIIVISEAPWAAEEGDWVISARANPNLSILELNDSNNTDQVNLRVSNDIFVAPEEAAEFDMTELTFNDEFDAYDSIDMYGTGKDGYKWYVNRAWAAGMVQQDSYTITDGVIKLHDQNPNFNVTMSTLDPFSGVGWSYNYGYLETKLRIVRPNYHEYLPGASGGIPAIWSLPVEKWTEQMPDRPSCQQWVEMDWLEYWGRDLERWPKYPDGYYTITLHDQITGRGDEDHWKVNGNSYKNGLGDGEWHTMGWLWTYNGVIAYIDHIEVFRISYSEDGTPSCSVRTQSGAINDIGAFSYMNYQDLVLYIAGAHDHPLELDYVRIWQGGSKSMPDPEDPSDDVIVDMEAEDFWYNYCTDDWGDPIVEANEENYQNILNGQEIWKQLSDERRAEINAYLESLGQPTYDKLLADALIIAEGGTPGGEPGTDSPDTGEGARAVPAMAAVAVLSAAALWISRKRKQNI